MLQVGIVGLPNVGKSTLFNALTAAGAAAENYPFCTVDPNVGVVEVPDSRLDRIHALSSARSRVPTAVEFVDIAGLVEGASRGEGLGNQFLAQIREVDAIAHVLRCFRDPDVSHVLGDVDPVRDLEVVEMELALADLETVERRADRVERKARSGEKGASEELEVLEALQEALSRGEPARSLELSGEWAERMEDLRLLTLKPVLYVANVEEGGVREEGGEVQRLTKAVAARAGGEVVSVCSELEAELAELDPEARGAFLEELGLDEPGLHRLVRSAYRVLDLITFFTTNEKETRAWTVPRGTRAPEAAGRIHTDFQRGFIRAETISFEDLVRVGGLKAARSQGLVRSEGKDYVVQDGDLILFRFNV